MENYKNRCTETEDLSGELQKHDVEEEGHTITTHQHNVVLHRQVPVTTLGSFSTGITSALLKGNYTIPPIST
ncbi:unnamed protein product [Prunus armeniaca]|uniref:Uncharacterized protein n=1 Tax=Prunus armeniaca TaxID=36596 RepID=A0A6J5WXV6_PRUAR|nr:unnamed protein product [Prunus armeniaca]